MKPASIFRAPEDRAAYLNAAVRESDGDPRLLMTVLRNVASAQGGVFRHRSESPSRSGGPCPVACRKPEPRLGTVTKIAAACGVMLRLVERMFGR